MKYLKLQVPDSWETVWNYVDDVDIEHQDLIFIRSLDKSRKIIGIDVGCYGYAYGNRIFCAVALDKNEWQTPYIEYESADLNVVLAKVQDWLCDVGIESDVRNNKLMNLLL